jgi:hypothetical protein
MTKESARTVANIALVTVGVAAAYVVVTTPPLRRLASIAMRSWLGASIPVFLLQEVSRAWAEGGRRSPPQAGERSMPATTVEAGTTAARTIA